MSALLRRVFDATFFGSPKLIMSYFVVVWIMLIMSLIESTAEDFDEHGRLLQAENSTTCILANGTDLCQCTYPRPDGLIIFNPKCQNIGVIIAIPFINALIGMGTNWLALKMTFFPLEFWGWEVLRCEDQPVGLFGWQGIIPTKAGKMAQKSVRMMTEKLFNVNEIFKRVEPKMAVERMKPGFNKVMNDVLGVQLAKQIPPDSNFASFLPTVKSQMMGWAEQEMPEFAGGFMEDLIKSLDDVFDLEYMVVNEFVEDKMLLNNVFLKVGANELRFIINSGFGFGLLFGGLFLPLYLHFPEFYVLPIVGAFVGYATNAIALKMMFAPIDPHPVKCCCGRTINFQGLFLQRQQEASAVFANLTTKQILNSHYMFHYMLNGPKRTAFRALLVRHLNTYVDKVLGRSHTLIRAYIGEDEFIKMRQDIEDATLANVEEIFATLYTYTDEALALEDEIRTKMAALPPGEFEGVLHPVFEEDEAKLIAVGAALGAIAGVLQSLLP